MQLLAAPEAHVLFQSHAARVAGWRGDLAKLQQHPFPEQPPKALLVLPVESSVAGLLPTPSMLPL